MAKSDSPPAPLLPYEVDLRDFPYLPLDVVRLRDSEFAVVSSGDEFRCAVLLWCACWHQVPASSLPDDDRLLANLAGFGRDVDAWKAVRPGALRGYIKCHDGRLYHPVIAAKALKAHAQRRAQCKRTEAATAARQKSKRDGQRDHSRNDERDGCPDDQDNVDQVKGTEENQTEVNGFVDVAEGCNSTPLFSPDDFALAERIVEAQRISPSDPAVSGTVQFAKIWRAHGWNAELIVATIRRVMSKRTTPPNSARYFEKAIADAHSELARPLPDGRTRRPLRRKKTFADLKVEMEALANAELAEHTKLSERHRIVRLERSGLDRQI